MTGLLRLSIKVIRALYSDSRKVLSAQRAAVERERAAYRSLPLDLDACSRKHYRKGRGTCLHLGPYDIARSRYSRALTHTY